MSLLSNRREFLRDGATVGAAAGFWIAGVDRAYGQAKSPNAKLNVACIGVGGRGAGNVSGVSGETIVALCDVDRRNLDKAGEKLPDARKYTDFRRMLDEIGKEIDAVTVSTADHTHAVASVAAIKQGKHVYVEKPMAHDVHEARVMRKLASEKKVATQMGNQGTSGNNLRESVEIIRAGAIGDVKDVHIWTNRPIWPQSPGISARPKDGPGVPDWLDWDGWLGPAPERPYHPAYHPFKWRGWWDFGTGALGDMACHTANLPFMALRLDAPVSVEAESEPPNPETCPGWAKIVYEFPARDPLPACRVTWYEGKKISGERVLPPEELLQDEKISNSGCLIVGSKGTLYSPDDYGGKSVWLPKGDFAELPKPAPSLPRSPGHHKEWIDACKGGAPALSNFEYAGPLTEFVLLGNVAIRAGKKLEWDAAALKATNCPEADPFIKREYRKGWTL
jgi:predicted dehydrogenase